jgi:ElaB/YqjD/DUF883 family membrane-anchored ribosome-binding protein
LLFLTGINLTSLQAASETPDGKSQILRTTRNHDSQVPVVLDDASEDEQEELFPDTGDKAEKSAAAIRENKREREEKLKQMMETDDADGLSLFHMAYSRAKYSHNYR